MISELTKEQEAKLPEYVDKWIKIGLCTDPSNREEAEKWIQVIYKQAGFETPQIVWCDGPLEALESFASLTHTMSKNDFLFNLGYGYQDANWLAYLDFFHTEVKLTGLEPILPHIELAKCTGWYSPFDTHVFMIERASRILKNESGLHCEDGPAFVNGSYKYYSLNGCAVPEFVVMTPADELDPWLIFKSEFPGFTNTHEVRSEILKKIGAKRALDSLNFTLVERMTGEELFSKYPIGNYKQQGDVLMLPGEILPDGSVRELPIAATNQTFDELEARMKIRLRSKVSYELYKTTIIDTPCTALRMGNPSLFGEEHVEFVSPDCNTIFEAYIYRNFGETKDWKGMIRENKAFLPCELS